MTSSRIPVYCIAALLNVLACGGDGLQKASSQLVVQSGAELVDADASKWRLDFGPTSTVGPKRQKVTLGNTGSTRLTITRVAQGDTLRAFLAVGTTIEAGAEAAFEVEAYSEYPGEANLDLQIESDGGKVNIDVRALFADLGGCRLRITPGSIRLPAQQTGGSVTQNIEVVNLGNSPCPIQSIWWLDGVSPNLSLPESYNQIQGLPARSTWLVPVEYTAGAKAPGATGTVRVTYAGATDWLTFDIPVEVEAGQVGGTCDTNPAACELASVPVYLSSGTALYTLDVATKFPVKVGDYTAGGAPLTGFGDIAIDKLGRIFGINLNGGVYQIDSKTAACSRVAQAGNAPGNAMTVLASGELLVGSGDTLWTVNPNTGKVGPGRKFGGVTSSGDLILTSNNVLYWSIIDTNRRDALARVDLGQGSYNRSFKLPAPNILGLALLGPDLLAFAFDGSAYLIDLSTEAVKETFQVPLTVNGAAGNPAGP